MAPHRRGGHAQLLQVPLASGIEPDPVEQAMAWARARLDQPLDISRWSRAVAMSPRTLTRRFQDRAGVSPHQWLVWQRVDLARRLLETTSLSVEGVASAAGFGSAQTLRLHFRDRLGTSPSDHRSAHAPRPES
jgi:transcriptional regulator GlxA family with amidase domain